MSGYHDGGRGGDRYAPPPRGRDSSGPSRPPPSGPARSYGGPLPSSTGPPRHPSSSYSRPPYDSAPRGPRYQDAPLHPRGYDPPAPLRRPNLSLMSTQNPGGRDGYHHSGQPQSATRSYPPATSYRDHDRDGYDRDRDYRGGFRDPRHRDVPPPRDSYQPPSGPRDPYRDPPRHTSSSYHPTYPATPSPPTGPRHGYSSYQPGLNRPSQAPSEPRSRERTPSGPAAWTGRSSTIDRRTGYFDSTRGRDISPGSSGPSRPRTPPYTGLRRDETRRQSPPPSSSYRRDSPDRRKSLDRKDVKTIQKQRSNESLESKQEETESGSQTADRMEDTKQQERMPPKPSVETDEEALTQSDVDRRIRAIDEEMEATERRIAQIDAERGEHQRELERLRKAMQTVPEPPEPSISEVKTENIEEEVTEEEVETTTETPVDVDGEEDQPQVSAPPRKEMRMTIVRKRARTTSEIEEDGENLRVRIWRLLKTKEAKEDSTTLESPSITTISNSEPLNQIESVSDLPDFEEAELLHKNSRHAIFRTLQLRRKRQQYRQDKLRRKYHQRYILWQAHMDKLDAQRQKHLERLGLASKVEVPAAPAMEGAPIGTPGTEIVAPDAGTRGTRRAQQAAHARDYVQSEAEFLELMASLGTGEKDPTAQIPDMLPPDERDMIDFDESALIHNPVEFYTRALFSVEEGTKVDIEGWTEEENKAFSRRLNIAGKQFGRFRKAIPLQARSVQELVQHYYFLKGHGVGLDWRNVISGKNRYGRGGGAGRGGAANVLIGSGAPGGKGRGPGRGRGRTRSGPTVPLLQPKSRDDEDDDTRSAMEDDGDDSGSVTTERVRALRGKKSRVFESTAAKQRPKRSTGPVSLKEKTSQQIAPSPAPSSLEDSQDRIFPSTFGVTQSTQDLATDRDDSSVPPGGDAKRRAAKQPQTSSYWRVNEMEMFPKHLQTHGKNWHKIAEEMGTKTAQQVKNYFAKNADNLKLKKIVEDAESSMLKPSSGASYAKDPYPLHYDEGPRMSGDIQTSSVPMASAPVMGLQHRDSLSTALPERSPQLSKLPPPAQSAPQLLPLPTPPQQKLTLPTVASLLNSPPHETMRPMDRRPSWQEPLAPTPMVPAPLNAVPLTVPDIEVDIRRMRSPSNLSDISRSQSRGGDMYRSELARQSSYGSQPSIQTGPLRDDHAGYYREESRSDSLPPHNRYPPPQQTVLPSVRFSDQPLSQRSSYFPGNPYDSMAPPPGMSQESSYGRDPYARSPAQHRNIPSPLPPPAQPPHIIPSNDSGPPYYPPRESERRPGALSRDPRDVRESRFAPLREDPLYYGRDNREMYRYEEEDQARHARDRVFERERIDMHQIETERRERDRLMARDLQREREGWPRDRYLENYPPRQYSGLPPRTRSPVLPPGRDYTREREEREEWERSEREWMAREREYERDRWARR